jgi:hypothetical protein
MPSFVDIGPAVQALSLAEGQAYGYEELIGDFSNFFSETHLKHVSSLRICEVNAN